MLLSEQYPVHSAWELTLAPTGIVKGRVYTTDEGSGCIVLVDSSHKPSPSVHMIQAKHVVQAKKQRTGSGSASSNSSYAELPALPTKVSKKVLEEREKKAVRLAEESLRHINDKASPTGQACFDRLLKACNEVSWGANNSILVLNQIQVDPPYTAETCKIVGTVSGQATNSLERVQKIVAAGGSSNK